MIYLQELIHSSGQKYTVTENGILLKQIVLNIWNELAKNYLSNNYSMELIHNY